MVWLSKNASAAFAQSCLPLMLLGAASLLAGCASPVREGSSFEDAEMSYECIYPSVVERKDRLDIFVLEDFRGFRDRFNSYCQRSITLLSSLWRTEMSMAEKVAVTPLAVALTARGFGFIPRRRPDGCNDFSLEDIGSLDSVPIELLERLTAHGLFTGRINVLGKDKAGRAVTTEMIYEDVPATQLSMTVPVDFSMPSLVRMTGLYEGNQVTCRVQRTFRVSESAPAWAEFLNTSPWWWRDRPELAQLGSSMPVVDSFIINGVTYASPPAVVLPEIDGGALDGSDLTPSFAISQFPVTVADFNRYLRLNGQARSSESVVASMSKRDPVAKVSLLDARAYADWLSVQTGERWRIPSMAEWIYAAEFAYEGLPWGGLDKDACLFGNLRFLDGERKNRACSQIEGSGVVAVGAFLPLPPGIYDLYGNVWELTDTCQCLECSTPDERAPGCESVIALGGSHMTDPKSLKRNPKLLVDPEALIDDVGFRLVREL